VTYIHGIKLKTKYLSLVHKRYEDVVDVCASGAHVYGPAQLVKKRVAVVVVEMLQGVRPALSAPSAVYSSTSAPAAGLLPSTPSVPMQAADTGRPLAATAKERHSSWLLPPTPRPGLPAGQQSRRRLRRVSKPRRGGQDAAHPLRLPPQAPRRG
jgi:hypothetical protein